MLQRRAQLRDLLAMPMYALGVRYFSLDLTLDISNPSKTCLVVKEPFYDAAVEMFRGSGVSITADGKQHLGGALGSPSFVTSFVKDKVSTWAKEFDLLSNISITHPHAAYVAFSHGFIGKWNYLMRCFQYSDFLAPLESILYKIISYQI